MPFFNIIFEKINTLRGVIISKNQWIEVFYEIFWDVTEDNLNKKTIWKIFLFYIFI